MVPPPSTRTLRSSNTYANPIVSPPSGRGRGTFSAGPQRGRSSSVGQRRAVGSSRGRSKSRGPGRGRKAATRTRAASNPPPSCQAGKGFRP
eukprot:scaffold175559_cov30-Cyclotella_meneghiniana.AAC.1